METNFQEKKMSISRNALNYGVMLGVAQIIFNLLMYIFNLYTQNFIQYLGIALMLAFIIIGILNYRNKINAGYISYGNSLGTGVLIGLYASIIYAVYYFILVKFIDSGIIAETIRSAEEKLLESRPDMTDEEIEMAMNVSRILANPYVTFFSSIISSTFAALIGSLIISAFTMKKDSVSDSQMPVN